MLKTALLASTLTMLALPAFADPIFGVGSDFTVYGTAAGETFDNTSVVFAPGTQLIAPNLDLTIAITPDPSVSQSEWVTLIYQTVDGTQLTPGGGFFQLQTVGIPTVIATNFIGDTSQFINAAGMSLAQSPGPTGLFGQTLFANNPDPGGVPGQAEGTLGYSSPFAVGPLPQLGAYADNLGYDLGNNGVDVTQVSGFVEGLQFAPQSPIVGVPEPAPTAALMSVGLLGLGMIVRKRQSGRRGTA